MKDYDFDFTNQRYTLTLIGLCFFSFALMLVIMITLDLSALIWSILLAFLVPVFIFWYNRKKIRKTGYATVYGTNAEFRLPALQEKIEFADIKSYKVSRHQSTSLEVELKDGKTFKLYANPNFCIKARFDNVCATFDKAVQQYKTDHHADLIKKKSFF